jgi:hypothetical protein
MFSFLLCGGQSGTDRTYGLFIVSYSKSCMCCYNAANIDGEDITSIPSFQWVATCLCFVTRVPLLDDLTQCLLALYGVWINPQRRHAVEFVSKRSRWKSHYRFPVF